MCPADLVGGKRPDDSIYPLIAAADSESSKAAHEVQRARWVHYRVQAGGLVFRSVTTVESLRLGAAERKPRAAIFAPHNNHLAVWLVVVLWVLLDDRGAVYEPCRRTRCHQ